MRHNGPERRAAASGGGPVHRAWAANSALSRTSGLGAGDALRGPRATSVGNSAVLIASEASALSYPRAMRRALNARMASARHPGARTLSDGTALNQPNHQDHERHDEEDVDEPSYGV
jgi:hypothetical protein